MLGTTRIVHHYFGAEPGPTRRILFGTLVNNISFGTYLALVPIYLAQVARLPVTRVGIVSALTGVVMVMVAPHAGRLADRYQPRLIGAVTRPLFGLSVATFALVHTFAAAAALAVTGAVMNTTARTANNVIVAHAGGDRPAEFRARARSIAGIGQTLAAGLVACILGAQEAGAYDAGLALLAGLGVTSAVTLLSLPDIEREPAPVTKGSVRRDWAVLRDRTYLAVVALSAVFYLSYAVEQIGLPLWIITHTDLAKPWRAFFMAADAVFVAGLGVQIGRRIGTVRAAGRATAFSGVLFAASYLGIAMTGWTHGWRAAAILVALTLVYATASTTYHNAENTLSMSLAPPDRRGEYLSLLSSVEGIAQIAGPVLMAVIVVTFKEAGWLILGAVFASAGLMAIPVAAAAQPAGRHRRNLRRQRRHGAHDASWDQARGIPDPTPNAG